MTKTLTFQDVVDAVRPIMRMIDKDVAIQMAITQHGDNQTITRYPENAIPLLTGSNRNAPEAVVDYFLTRSGKYVAADRFELDTGEARIITRHFREIDEKHLAEVTTPAQVRKYVVDRLLESVESTKKRLVILESRIEVLTNL